MVLVLIAGVIGTLAMWIGIVFIVSWITGFNTMYVSLYGAGLMMVYLIVRFIFFAK